MKHPTLTPLELGHARQMMMTSEKATPPTFRAIVKVAHYLKHLKPGVALRDGWKLRAWRQLPKHKAVD